MRAGQRYVPSSTARIAALAKLAAAGAVSGRTMKDPVEHLAWIDSGAPFEEAGVSGFLGGLPDLPDGPIPAEAILRMRAALSSAGPESAGSWYMETVPREFRHPRGEFYTPRWLVSHVLDRAGFDGSSSLIDPMCGAGAFVIAALERTLRRHPGIPALELTERIRGMDVSPLAVLLARSAYLLALAASGWRPGQEPIRIPVDCADAILSPSAARQFDVVAGNPPWIGWENLPEETRRLTRSLWTHHGLFPDKGSGMSAMLGRGKKDLAMLATYTAADKFLAQRGTLSFIVPQSALKSVGGGAGFRRFVLGDGTPLKVSQVDDFGSMSVFPNATSRAAVVTLTKGERTTYPVPVAVWRRRQEAPLRHQAEPLRHADPSSPWITGTSERLGKMRRILGPSDYRARAGAYTGGANGVYWFEVTQRGENGHWMVRNLAGSGKRSVPCITTVMESELLFPLLRARDVGRFRAGPSAWILLPQDPERRRGIPIEIMEASYPKALAYLERVAGLLADRRDRGTRALIDSGAPFYSIFSVSTETLSRWKVVWPRIASRLTPAVVGPHEGRPVVPQETCTFVACSGEEEACYLAGMLASDLAGEAVASFTQAGSKSFGAPHILSALAIPRFDPSRPAHTRLVSVVKRVQDDGADVPHELQEAAGEAW